MSSRRLKVKFPTSDAYFAGTAIESPGTLTRVISEERLFIAIEASSDQGIDVVSKTAYNFEKEYGASIFEDNQYDFDPIAVENDVTSWSLDDVVNLTNAPIAWDMGYTGKGVAIAVIDSGIDDTCLKIAEHKGVGGWAVSGHDPWTDWNGHGTMCACIAAGTKKYGGVFNGTAPDATVIPCRTHFYDSELTDIYDYLRNLQNDSSLNIIASNSFGIRTGTAPTLSSGSDFPDALGDAIDAGVFVCFSAGNNHEIANGLPDNCTPNSIWLHKARADVLTVATCDLDDSIWYYSSRGLGQHFGAPNTSRKPDVTAPTPRIGRVVYGDQVQSIRHWGTSGACPQVAGLAALLLQSQPELEREVLFNAIRDGAVAIDAEYDCGGHGRIDCVNSLRLVK